MPRQNVAGGAKIDIEPSIIDLVRVNSCWDTSSDSSTENDKGGDDSDDFE